MSPRPRMFPNRLPGPAPAGGSLGLNLLPFDHVSSRSAALTAGGPPSLKPDPRRFMDTPDSESIEPAVEDRTAAREERQSDAVSERDGGAGSRVEGGPSNRLREPSREEGRSGRGPSRLQFPANLASSSNPPPPKPERSFAVMMSGGGYLCSEPELTRFGHTHANCAASQVLCHHFRQMREWIEFITLTEPVLVRASFKPSKSTNSMYPNPFGLSSRSLIIFTDLVCQVLVSLAPHSGPVRYRAYLRSTKEFFKLTLGEIKSQIPNESREGGFRWQRKVLAGGPRGSIRCKIV